MNLQKVMLLIISFMFSLPLIGMGNKLIVFQPHTIQIAHQLKKMTEKASDNVSPEQVEYLKTIFDDFEIAEKAAVNPDTSLALEEKTIRACIIFVLKNGGKITDIQNEKARLINKHKDEIELSGKLFTIASDALSEAIPNYPCSIM